VSGASILEEGLEEEQMPLRRWTIASILFESISIHYIEALENEEIDFYMPYRQTPSPPDKVKARILNLIKRPGMSSSPNPIFCCSLIEPYRPRIPDHERKFQDFLSWAQFPRTSSSSVNSHQEIPWERNPPRYAVQLVRQVNYGPLESKRYFVLDQMGSSGTGG
jgi:hypothetical protein